MRENETHLVLEVLAVNPVWARRHPGTPHHAASTSGAPAARGNPVAHAAHATHAAHGRMRRRQLVLGTVKKGSGTTKLGPQ